MHWSLSHAKLRNLLPDHRVGVIGGARAGCWRGRLPGKDAAIELTLFRCPDCEKEGLKERSLLDQQGTLEYQAGENRVVWTSAGVSIAQDLARLTDAILPGER